MTVENKWLSNRTSEGFYLYLFPDGLFDENGDANTGRTIYMKAEFNHAGYGRTIPMMAPYHTNGSGFKKKQEIKKLKHLLNTTKPI